MCASSLHETKQMVASLLRQQQEIVLFQLFLRDLDMFVGGLERLDKGDVGNSGAEDVDVNGVSGGGGGRGRMQVKGIHGVLR